MTSSPNSMEPLCVVVLTEDEREECQRFWDSLKSERDGSFYARTEAIGEELKRSIASLALIGRAERYALLGESNKKECMDMACATAAKACALYPLSVYFYDFANILLKAQREDEAKIMFAIFLQRHEAVAPSPIGQSWLKQRDLDSAIKYAMAYIYNRD